MQIKKIALGIAVLLVFFFFGMIWAQADNFIKDETGMLYSSVWRRRGDEIL